MAEAALTWHTGSENRLQHHSVVQEVYVDEPAAHVCLLPKERDQTVSIPLRRDGGNVREHQLLAFRGRQKDL